MYGPPKTSMTLPMLETLFGIADAPEIKTSDKPFTGTLSPGYTGYDSFDGQLFSHSYNMMNDPNTPAPLSNQFDRFPTDPFTAGQNAALINPMDPFQLIRRWSNVNY